MEYAAVIGVLLCTVGGLILMKRNKENNKEK